MPTRLKVFLHDLSYALLFGLMASLIYVTITFKGTWMFAFLLFASVDVLFQCSIAKTDFIRNADLARRWKRVTGRTYAEYPRTPKEKDAILSWATACLVERATKASAGFRERDALYATFKKVEAMTPGSGVDVVPQALPRIRRDLRNRIAIANGTYSYAYLTASVCHQSYLALWDLFRDMKMLPVDPMTGKVYADPNKFRKTLEGGPAAPDDIAGLTPETAS